ncbi:MAG: hypothetical protein Q9O62_08075 [Ardenticatenia bacterium]|nr:hypothetical protein [Ardenticatenia bacterium]
MMDGSFRRAFAAVLYYEIRQGLRSPAWWLLILNFGLPVLLTSASPLDPWAPFARRVFIPVILALAFLLVAPFVYLLAFEREDTPWGHDIFWVRLPHIGGAFLAKTVAGVVLVLLAAAPVLAWTLSVAVFYHGWDGLRGWGQALYLIFLPAAFVYLALVLIAMLLLPHRFGKRVLSLCLMLGLVFLQDQIPLLHLWSPLTKVYFSPVTDLHPFGKLLVWHRLFWLLLTVGITLWALSRLSRRARRPLGIHEQRWAQQVQWLGVGLMLVALFPAWGFYREKAVRFYEVEPNPALRSHFEPGHDGACPQAYQVDVTFDLSRLQVRGLATWQGTSITPRLQAGLVGTPVQAGQQMRMEYQGSPRWPRQLIWCPECARDLPLLSQRVLQPYLLGWYFVEGHMFLLITGSWHPFPGCPVERLQVRLEHLSCESCIAVTGTPERQSVDKAWVYLWENPPAQGPLLAMSRAYRVIEQEGRRFLLPRHMFPSQVQGELVAPYWTALERMEESGLLSEGEARTLAVVDHLVYPRWGQDGLVLVPVIRSTVEDDPLAYQRYIALMLLMGWWCQGAESCVTQFADTLFDWGSQQTALPLDISPEDADQLAQQLALQEQTSPEEVSVLPNLFLYATYRLHDPISTYHPLAMDISGVLAYPFLIKQSPLVLKFLDALYQHEPAHFWHILRAYRDTYGMEDISLATFVQWVEADLDIMLPDPDIMPSR